MNKPITPFGVTYFCPRPTGFKPIEGDFTVTVDLGFSNPHHEIVVPEKGRWQIVFGAEDLDGDLKDYDQEQLLTWMVTQAAYEIKNKLFFVKKKEETDDTK